MASLLLLQYGSRPTISALSVGIHTRYSIHKVKETNCRSTVQCVIMNCLFMLMLITRIPKQLSVNTRFFPTLII